VAVSGAGVRRERTLPTPSGALVKSKSPSLTLAEAFPALVPAIAPALRTLPLSTLRHLKAWGAIVQTLALAAARRRERRIGELVPFPPSWCAGDLAGRWNPPPRCRAVGPRTLRTFERAGVSSWRDVLERTPQELLEGSGAGLMMLSDVLSCAIELAATGLSEPPGGESEAVLGLARKNYAIRRARA
jgi:hypothetical protein